MELKELFHLAVTQVFERVQQGGSVAYIREAESKLEVVSLPNGQKQWQRTNVVRSNSRLFINEHWKALLSETKLQAFLDELVEAAYANRSHTDILLQLGDDKAAAKERISEFLLNTMMNLAYCAGQSVPPSHDIDRTWAGLQEFYLQDHITVEEKALLVNFDADVDRIVVEDGIEIHRMTDSEISDWASSPLINIRDYHDFQWVVTWEYMSKHPDYGRGYGSPSYINALVLALHLMGHGGVYTRQHSHSSKYPFPGYGGKRGKEENPRMYGGTFHLATSDIQALTHIFRKVVQHDLESDVAASRFERSYTERLQGGKLTELVIALEGLFVPEGGDSIAYRLAARAARLLKHDVDERYNTFRMLKTLYNLRSSILHGSKLDISDGIAKQIQRYANTVTEFSDIVQSLVRSALQKRLDNPGQFTHEALDRMMLQ